MKTIEEGRGREALATAADGLEQALWRRNGGADGHDRSELAGSGTADGAADGRTNGLADAGPDRTADGRIDETSGTVTERATTPRRPAFRNRRQAESWHFNRRGPQMPPPGDWRVWLLMGGRGSGKTRAGAEWVHALASARPQIRIALVAETLGDAREVMIDGVSGICRIAGRSRPEFEASRRRLVWPNGSIGQIFSSEDPESLRGPQFHLAWCDELGKWKHAQETWDMLQFGLRLGEDPRVLVTTTPRPVPLLRAMAAEKTTVVRRIRTADNAQNLSPGFIAAMAERYGGTRLGRQELDGELIADREDALWSRARLEAIRLRQTGPLSRIVVAVDPPATASAASVCGIVVAGLDATGRAVVLADCSVTGASPAGWAGAVVRAFRRFDADRVVAEVNQGGDMVSAMLRSVDANLPVTTVRATRGKFLRAEPVAALYEQGRVAHAAAFAELEDQMCDFGPDGLSSGRSPDRLDALVWALTALVIDRLGEPRVRGI
jgi:phage terminase large subunit-like protein